MKMNIIDVKVMYVYNIRFDSIKPSQESPCGETIGVCLFADDTTYTSMPFGIQSIADAISARDKRIWPVGNGISHIGFNSILFAARLDFTNNRSRALATVYGVDLDDFHLECINIKE